MVGYSDQNSMMSKEDDTSIGKLRQMIANLQVRNWSKEVLELVYLGFVEN